MHQRSGRLLLYAVQPETQVLPAQFLDAKLGAPARELPASKRERDADSRSAPRKINGRPPSQKEKALTVAIPNSDLATITPLLSRSRTTLAIGPGPSPQYRLQGKLLLRSPRPCSPCHYQAETQAEAAHSEIHEMVEIGGNLREPFGEHLTFSVRPFRFALEAPEEYCATHAEAGGAVGREERQRLIENGDYTDQRLRVRFAVTQP